jgi:hypothetical protein
MGFHGIDAVPGLIPSYTTVQRMLLTPLRGQQVYDIDIMSMLFYNGSSWVIIG